MRGQKRPGQKAEDRAKNKVNTADAGTKSAKEARVKGKTHRTRAQNKVNTHDVSGKCGG